MLKVITFCFSLSFLVLASAAETTLGSLESTLPPVQTCSAEISSQCPPEDGEDPVYYPDPEDCGSFCECSSGEAFLIHCQPGTLWDAENNICDFPENVDCGDRPVPPPPFF